VTTRSAVATIRPVQILTTKRPTDRHLPLWHSNLCPVHQNVFRSNSNISVIQSAKHNFACLITEHILYLVSNQGSPVTTCIDNFTFCTTQQSNWVNPLKLNDAYTGRTAQLTSKSFILYIYVLNILNMVYTIRFFLFKVQFFFYNLVPALFTFYIQSVLKLKTKSGAKRLMSVVLLVTICVTATVSL